MDVVFAVARRITVLHQGAVLAEGRTARGPGQRRGAARLPRAGQVPGAADAPPRPCAGSRPTTATATSSSISRSRSGRARSCVCSGETAQARPPPSRASRGLVPPRGGTHRPARPGTGRRFRRSASRAWASATCLKSAASSATSPCARTSKSRARPGRAAPPGRPSASTSCFRTCEALRDRQAGRLSGGEQQMLTIARTLMGSPARPAPRRAIRGAGPAGRPDAGRAARRAQGDRADHDPRRAERPLRQRAGRPRLRPRERARCATRARWPLSSPTTTSAARTSPSKPSSKPPARAAGRAAVRPACGHLPSSRMAPLLPHSWLSSEWKGGGVRNGPTRSISTRCPGSSGWRTGPGWSDRARPSGWSRSLGCRRPRGRHRPHPRGCPGSA